MNSKGTVKKAKLKLGIVLLLVFGVLCGAAYYEAHWTLHNTVSQIGSQFAEKQVLYDKERSLRPLLREVSLAQKLATSETIHEWLKDEFDPELKTRGIQELENFRQSFMDHSYFFAMKSSGHYYFNDADNQYEGKQFRYTLDENNPEDGWFFATLKQAEICMLNVDYDEQVFATKVWINCVVREGDEPVGVIGTGIDLTTFIRDVVESEQEGISNMFIDLSGAIQAHRDAAFVDFRSITKNVEERHKIFDILDNKSESEQFKKLMEQLRAGKVDAGSMYIHINGQRYLAGVSFIKEFGWYNVTLIEIDALFGKEHNKPVLFMAGVAFICLLGIFFLVSGWLEKSSESPD